METYLGVKIVKAESWLGIDNKCVNEVNGKQTIVLTGHEDEGYKVVYEDGYTSWSPKDVFEKAYRKIKVTEDLINVVECNEYQQFQQRVIDEASELNIKINVLDDFILNNNIYKKLPEDEQVRLIQQVRAMEYYFSVLIERIQNFK